MALAHQYRDAYRHNEHRDVRERHRPTGKRTAAFTGVGYIYRCSYMVKTVGVSGVYVENKGQLSVHPDNPGGRASI